MLWCFFLLSNARWCWYTVAIAPTLCVPLSDHRTCTCNEHLLGHAFMHKREGYPAGRTSISEYFNLDDQPHSTAPASSPRGRESKGMAQRNNGPHTHVRMFVHDDKTSPTAKRLVRAVARQTTTQRSDAPADRDALVPVVEAMRSLRQRKNPGAGLTLPN